MRCGCLIRLAQTILIEDESQKQEHISVIGQLNPFLDASPRVLEMACDTPIVSLLAHNGCVGWITSPLQCWVDPRGGNIQASGTGHSILTREKARRAVWGH